MGKRHGTLVVLVLMVVAFAHASAMDGPHDAAGPEPDSRDAPCIHAAGPLPSRGIPPELPPEWGTVAIDPPFLGKGESSHQVLFVHLDQKLEYHAIVFASSLAASSYFDERSENASDLQWNPGLGADSVAWMESPTEFHVVAVAQDAVLHLVESRGSTASGPWPDVALHAAAGWLPYFQTGDC